MQTFALNNNVIWR